MAQEPIILTDEVRLPPGLIRASLTEKQFSGFHGDAGNATSCFVYEARGASCGRIVFLLDEVTRLRLHGHLREIEAKGAGRC